MCTPKWYISMTHRHYHQRIGTGAAAGEKDESAFWPVETGQHAEDWPPGGLSLQHAQSVVGRLSDVPSRLLEQDLKFDDSSRWSLQRISIFWVQFT